MLNKKVVRIMDSRLTSRSHFLQIFPFRLLTVPSHNYTLTDIPIVIAEAERFVEAEDGELGRRAIEAAHEKRQTTTKRNRVTVGITR